MNSIEQISESLREKGFRMTKARIAILEFFLEEHCALSAADLLAMLKKKKIKADTSTVYRELEFLLSQGITQEVILKDATQRYELAAQPHHHHLVCNSCSVIEPVQMENDLSEIEKTIAKKKNFQVQSHSLEFYGQCEECSL